MLLNPERFVIFRNLVGPTLLTARLAISATPVKVPHLAILERCACGDDFCATFYTKPKPNGAYGPGHRNVVLAPDEGMVILDVVREGLPAWSHCLMRFIRLYIFHVFVVHRGVLRCMTGRPLNGFIQIRRGLLEHAERGSIGLLDLGVYLQIQLQANYETGVWMGSAAKLAATAPRDADDRSVRRSLESLERAGFIKRFLVRGKRGNYPVVINKYEPHSGAMKGRRLNAEQ